MKEVVKVLKCECLVPEVQHILSVPSKIRVARSL
jgi:hypothetical protein